MLTLRELSARLRLDERTIRRWVALGTFPRPMRLGGILRWPDDEVTVWLEARRTLDRRQSST
jgi:excisionase family DNA binding protein